MRIGDLARQAGLSIRAIRYYEERGLLQPVARTPGNYRLYDYQALRILKTFRRLKMLGMGLDDISELNGIYAREGDCTGSLRGRFLGMIQERTEEIDRRIEELTLLREELSAHHRRLTEFLASQTDESLNRTCCDLLSGSPDPVPTLPRKCSGRPGKRA